MRGVVVVVAVRAVCIRVRQESVPRHPGETVLKVRGMVQVWEGEMGYGGAKKPREKKQQSKSDDNGVVGHGDKDEGSGTCKSKYKCRYR